MNRKISGILLGLILLGAMVVTTSCHKFLMFYWGFHAPRVENKNELVSYFDQYGFDTSRIFFLKEDRYIEFLNDFGNTMLFTPSGVQVKFIRVDSTGCSAPGYYFVLNLDPSASLSLDTGAKKLSEYWAMLDNPPNQSWQVPGTDFYLIE